jgi:hypothetical protein
VIVRSRIDFYNIFQATVLVFVVGINSRAGGLGGGRLLLFFFFFLFFTSPTTVPFLLSRWLF